MTNAPVTRCINEVLPEEVFGVIFEEHAKLEWRAPVIDAQVCHQWRQTILHSPRVWAYPEFPQSCKPAPLNLHQWLDRSGSLPLHIQLMEWICGAEEVLDPHCKRIKSISLSDGLISFLKNRSFPILQSLTIRAAYRSLPLMTWSTPCTMPALRSFRASNISVNALPSNIFPALRTLALYRVDDCDCIIRNTSHSLTSLMLSRITLQYTSESLEFPSLRFLSLFWVRYIKHRMNVPALTTYHESDITDEESFPVSLPFLIEYGIHRPTQVPPLNVTRLHQCYPNISRLSLRTHRYAVKPFLRSLSSQPTALPMLRLLAVGGGYDLIGYSGEDKDIMKKAVFMRNMTSSVKMELCFDGKDRVPLYFAHVRVYINEGRSKLKSTLRTRIFLVEGPFICSWFVAALLMP